MTTSPPVIEQLSIDQLTPYAANSRTHPAEQIQQIADAIQRLGFLNPILVDSAGVIIAGHGRYEAAKQLGLHSVPVCIVDGLTADEADAFRLLDNRLQELSVFDPEVLHAELIDLQNAASDINLEQLLTVLNLALDPKAYAELVPVTPARIREFNASVIAITHGYFAASSLSDGVSWPHTELASCLDTREADAILDDPEFSACSPKLQQLFRLAATRLYRFDFSGLHRVYCQSDTSAGCRRAMELTRCVLLDRDHRLERALVRLYSRLGAQLLSQTELGLPVDGL